MQKFFDPGDLRGVGARAGFWANAPVHPLDLVFAGLDDQPQQIVGVGQRAQIGEGNRLIGARADVDIIAGGKIPLAPGDIGL